MTDEIISATRIRTVRSQIEQLVKKAKRQHLGGTEQGQLDRLIAYADYLTRKRKKQLKEQKNKRD